jgi:hypothetical protein
MAVVAYMMNHDEPLVVLGSVIIWYCQDTRFRIGMNLFSAKED